MVAVFVEGHPRFQLSGLRVDDCNLTVGSVQLLQAVLEQVLEFLRDGGVDGRAFIEMLHEAVTVFLELRVVYGMKVCVRI